jgi:hypothetical protein
MPVNSRLRRPPAPQTRGSAPMSRRVVSPMKRGVGWIDRPCRREPHVSQLASWSTGRARSRARRLGWLCFLALWMIACGDDSVGPAAARIECRAHDEGFGADADEGPCVLESGSIEGQTWMLLGSWTARPSAGSAGGGPCIDLQISTGNGAGWCDLPEARVIGEWVSGSLGQATKIAWGPVTPGRVAQVRIEFANGSPVEVVPRPTPWTEFDYWSAMWPGDRTAVAVVALDSAGEEVSREDLSGRPDSSPTPMDAPSPG